MRHTHIINKLLFNLYLLNLNSPPSFIYTTKTIARPFYQKLKKPIGKHLGAQNLIK